MVAVVASDNGGRTDRLIDQVLAPALAARVPVQKFHLGHHPLAADMDDCLAALAGADAFVLGTPIYRGTFAGALKQFIDLVPRASVGDAFASPFRARPIALVATGASEHHFLGLDPLISMLTRFFGAYVVPPTVYGRDVEANALACQAQQLGQAVVELARVLSTSTILRAQAPQV